MSDSEDDLSSGSITDVEDIEEDIDMEDVEEAVEMDEKQSSDTEEHELDEPTDKKREKHFRKEMWQIKKLPYSQEIEEQANKHFLKIKKGLADSVLLNDASSGFAHWTMELDRYIDFYGRRFSKEEHIQLIKLLLPLVSKGNIYRNVKIAMRSLFTLLCKRDFINRQDLIIDWRPLFELYFEVSYKNLEEDGLFLIPDGFRSDLHSLIALSRHYFSDESVQEVLDQCRPEMCVWDDKCLRTWKMMDLFICMAMPPEKQKIYGAGLWFDEAWYWFENIENNAIVDQYLIKLFCRISTECPGLIDWSDKLDYIFTRVIRSLRLSPQVSGLCQTFSLEHGTGWIVHMLGTEYHSQVIQHLREIFNQVESFLHPSNYGTHTQHIILLISKLCTHLLSRIKRERTDKSHKNRTLPVIPEKMRLSQEKLNEFIELLMPCLKLMVFTKTNKELVSPTFRTACLIAPKVVLPVVLDMVYPALETLVEPHRLIQTLSTLLGVLIPLVKDEPDAEGKTYRVHAITILNSLLPGLDCNDISKCMITYQVIGVLVNMIPLVDCSDAVHTRCDLTEDEKELCSATANYDSIISMIMDRMIEMLIECGQTASTTSAHGSIAAKTGNNIEEQILHRGTLSVFKGICRNSSSELFKIAFSKLYSLASENVFDSRIANDVVADMIHVSCKYHPEISFQKFFNLITNRLQECITPDFYTDEKVDFTTLWWLTMASRIVKVHPNLLLKNWPQIRVMIDLVMPFKTCSLATEKVHSIFDNLLEQLTSIQVHSLSKRWNVYDLPSDEFLSIRHWCAPVERKTWEPEWIVPTQESIDRATELLRDYLVPTIDQLNNPHGLNKKDYIHRLRLIRSALLGSCFSLPLFEGENIPLSDSHVVDPNEEMLVTVKPKGTPEISLDGKNVRQMALDCVLGLIDYLLEHCPDDVKSIQEAVTILRGLPSNRGYTKDLYTTSSASYRVTKLMLCDKLAGNKSNIEMIVEEYLMLLHRKRIATVQGWHFKRQHQQILETLLKVSTSSYSENRAKAQQILLGKLREHPYSYKQIIDQILWFLDPNNSVSHEQLKGALYLLIDGKKQALCLRMEFEQQAKIWPALVRVQHSEKPSIIALLESAQNLIVDNYESYRLKYEWTEANVEAAKNLLSCADETSPLQDSEFLKMPSQEQMEKYKDLLQTKYENAKKWYFTLVDRIFQLASDPAIHWRPLDMAHSMLSMQIRRDNALPGCVIKMFVKLLISDTVKTRRIACAMIASYLKITKPKSVKREYVIPNKDPENSAGAKFPFKCGFRDDNRVMVYEEEKLPTTDEEWDNFQFCGKQHYGFYIWPKKVITYAPLKEQTAIDRTYEDFNETEKFIVDTFNDEKFMTRLRELFSLEMKKEDETFNAIHFGLFQGLFRCFNDALSPAFCRQLEILMASPKEYEQKLAAEMTAGIVNGAKLWKYAKQRKMWNWLIPMLSKNLETMQEDGLRNWAVAIATICGCSEPRMLKPILDMLFKLLDRPSENAFAASSRLFLIHTALSQFEWRGVELWNKLLGIVKDSIVQPFANLRDRMAGTLTAATTYDLPTVHVSPNLPDRLKPPRVENVIAMYEEQLATCWDEVRIMKMEDCPVNGTMVNSPSSASLSETSEVKKAARLALKCTVGYVYNVCTHSYSDIAPSFIPLFPLFCHYSNDVGDEELQKSCHALNAGLMDAIFVSEKNSPAVLHQFTQILSSPCWWKSKVVALRMLRMIVFSNPFVFKKHRDEIGMLLVNALNDCQIEVREQAANALSVLLQVKFFETTNELVKKFETAGYSENLLEAHGGVLGLSSIVLAFPYSVPDFLPHVLMTICRFTTNKNATIRETVKRTLSEFKRTHQDSWREHEQQFNEDQLMVLRDLLISPNYYV